LHAQLRRHHRATCHPSRHGNGRHKKIRRSDNEAWRPPAGPSIILSKLQHKSGQLNSLAKLPLPAGALCSPKSALQCYGVRVEPRFGYARNMTSNHRRALELLAASSEGCTEALFAANDLPYALIFNLIREGLAIAKTEGVSPRQVRIKITDAGRAALDKG
jgi:hypothetical protein